MNALLAFVSESDLRVTGRVRGWHLPRWLRLWLITATRLGDGWLWLVAGSALVAGGGAGQRILGAMATSVAIANVALVFLKRRFRRRRPCDDASPSSIDERVLFLFPADRFSFPSGHSMNAFAIVTPVALAFPFLAPALGLLAASIAASRVVLGLHFVSDVVVGSALGALIGAASFFLVLG